MDGALKIEHPALWVHRGAAPPMREFHRHDDLEVNVVLEGGLEYLFGGRRLTVPAGHTAMFWAAAPHRLLTSVPVADSDVCWVHVPLSIVLRWALPDTFGARVMSHGTVVVPTDALGRHVPAQFGSWQRDLSGGADVRPVLLEVNALVLRILGHHGAGDQEPPSRPRGRQDLRPVALMAEFTARNFRDPLTVADIARAAGLNPNYATTLFRDVVGATLGEHLVRHRVAEAQRLLLTTTMTTAAVAHAAGFGSSSSLYAHFSRACGCSPGAYRASRGSVDTTGAVTRTAR